MLRKLPTLSLIALTAFAALAPVTTAPAEARNRGAKIAAGVIIGAAALAIIAANSNSARAQGQPRRSSYVNRCQRWYNECTDQGIDYSCEKYETRGCTE
jgi:hypothetical protein